MNNADFWASVRAIIAEGFTPEGLHKLDIYAAEFISGRLVYQRFSPQEQHGCATGGHANVIASLLAGAEVGTDSPDSSALSNYERECQRGAKQEAAIEQWAKVVGLWTNDVDEQLPQALGEQIAEGGEAKVYDHGATLIKSIGLDYFIQPIFALDRIALHNTYFPETRLTVIGFGRNRKGEFKVIAEQPFIDGQPVSKAELAAREEAAKAAAEKEQPAPEAPAAEETVAPETPAAEEMSAIEEAPMDYTMAPAETEMMPESDMAYNPQDEFGFWEGEGEPWFINTADGWDSVSDGEQAKLAPSVVFGTATEVDGLWCFELGLNRAILGINSSSFGINFQITSDWDTCDYLIDPEGSKDMIFTLSVE